MNKNRRSAAMVALFAMLLGMLVPAAAFAGGDGAADPEEPVEPAAVESSSEETGVAAGIAAADNDTEVDEATDLDATEPEEAPDTSDGADDGEGSEAGDESVDGEDSQEEAPDPTEVASTLESLEDDEEGEETNLATPQQTVSRTLNPSHVDSFATESRQDCQGWDSEKDGWHFVTRGQEQFKELTVTFKSADTQETYTLTLANAIQHPNAKHAYFVTDIGDQLLSATAQVSPDGGHSYFNLSHTCSGSDPDPDTFRVSVDKSWTFNGESDGPYAEADFDLRIGDATVADVTVTTSDIAPTQFAYDIVSGTAYTIVESDYRVFDGQSIDDSWTCTGVELGTSMAATPVAATKSFQNTCTSPETFRVSVNKSWTFNGVTGGPFAEADFDLVIDDSPVASVTVTTSNTNAEFDYDIVSGTAYTIVETDYRVYQDDNETIDDGWVCDIEESVASDAAVLGPTKSFSNTCTTPETFRVSVNKSWTFNGVTGGPFAEADFDLVIDDSPVASVTVTTSNTNAEFDYDIISGTAYTIVETDYRVYQDDNETIDDGWVCDIEEGTSPPERGAGPTEFFNNDCVPTVTFDKVWTGDGSGSASFTVWFQVGGEWQSAQAVPDGSTIEIPTGATAMAAAETVTGVGCEWELTGIEGPGTRNFAPESAPEGAQYLVPFGNGVSDGAFAELLARIAPAPSPFGVTFTNDVDCPGTQIISEFFLSLTKVWDLPEDADEDDFSVDFTVDGDVVDDGEVIEVRRFRDYDLDEVVTEVGENCEVVASTYEYEHRGETFSGDFPTTFRVPTNALNRDRFDITVTNEVVCEEEPEYDAFFTKSWLDTDAIDDLEGDVTFEDLDLDVSFLVDGEPLEDGRTIPVVPGQILDVEEIVTGELPDVCSYESSLDETNGQLTVPADLADGATHEFEVENTITCVLPEPPIELPDPELPDPELPDPELPDPELPDPELPEPEYSATFEKEWAGTDQLDDFDATSIPVTFIVDGVTVGPGVTISVEPGDALTVTETVGEGLPALCTWESSLPEDGVITIPDDLADGATHTVTVTNTIICEEPEVEEEIEEQPERDPDDPAQPEREIVAAAETMPRTGSSTALLSLIGALSLMLGAALLRRRRDTTA